MRNRTSENHVIGAKHAARVAALLLAGALLLGNALVGGWFAGAASAAGQKGVVVRLRVEGEKPAGDVVVHLTAGAEKVDLTPKDDGSSPDVNADDGEASGVAWIDADTITVSVTVGGKDLPGGEVAWGAEDVARDLSVVVSGENVSAEAGVPSGAASGVVAGTPPTGDAPADGAAPSGGAAPVGGGAPAGGLAGGSPVTQPPTTSGSSPKSGDAAGNPLLFVGLGAGALLLAGIGWFALRAGGGGDWLDPEPEAGLVGAGTPSPSSGLSVWITDDADVSSLADALLATLARHHRVLLVVEGAWLPPPVRGGPVWRGTDVRPKTVGTMIDAFLEDYGERPALLVVGIQDPARIAALAAALPDGVGGVVVSSRGAAVDAAAIVAVRSERGWNFTTAAGTIAARADEDGLCADPGHAV